MRLLIVEDNEELAELLAKGLQTAGYEADILSSVKEAASVLSATFYAALILDLGLPDGDGLSRHSTTCTIFFGRPRDARNLSGGM